MRDSTILLSSLGVVLCGLYVLRGDSGTGKQLDPAAWGSDHVGKPMLEYVTGDECLFCHRTDIGPFWSKNRHQRTIREPEPDSAALAALKKPAELKSLADDVQLLLGAGNHSRFLKKDSSYGKLDLLSVTWDRSGGLHKTEKPHWDGRKFADACAGCHTTAVDPQTRAFSAVALDCYTCHGSVTLDHSKNTQLIHLSKKRHDPASVIASICGQCHVRTGKAKSTGLPYPNNFVAGDNLFRDFQVDLSEKALQALSPADRHVLENIRDVVVLGKEETTCLSCHEVHKQSTKKHRRLLESPSCVTCHNATGSKKIRPAYEVHSHTCEY
ncbi:MAG TPA: hypothetical protein VK395_35945 [Gemmataceae bacterium]|nr:hypothetical protein [Gemmataceae bacterium]